MTPRAVFSGLLVLLGLVVPVAAQESLPLGFSLTQVGFGPFAGQPVGFAFLPDGRLLIIDQKTGEILLNPVDADSSVVIHKFPDVESFNAERGLLGITCDPQWPSRPYVYCYYTNVDTYAHLVMLTASGELTEPTSTDLSFTQTYTLLNDVPDSSPLHQAGTLRFGPDGMLYVSLGDDGWGCDSQRLHVLSGEILRLDVSAMPRPGAGPPPKLQLVADGNPFGGDDPNTRLVWVWGLRNPFRFTIDELTGDLFIGDVGRIDFEELDHAPYAGGGGENYGWPQREGHIDPGLGLTCGLENEFTDPIYVYPHVDGQSIIAGPRYRPVGGSSVSFSADYDGSVFLLEFWSGWMRRLVLDGSSWALASAVPGQPSAENWAEGLPFVSDIQRGPDGALYLCNLLSVVRPAGIYRLAGSGPTSTPAPVIASAGPTVRPNPLSGSGTTISWLVRRAGSHELRIYDTSGRLVRSISRRFTAGTGTLHWKGEGDGNHPVPAGVYLFALREPGGRKMTGKVTVVR